MESEFIIGVRTLFISGPDSVCAEEALTKPFAFDGIVSYFIISDAALEASPGKVLEVSALELALAVLILLLHCGGREACPGGVLEVQRGQKTALFFSCGIFRRQVAKHLAGRGEELPRW